jgi:uncharacterized protein DUF421
MSPGLSPGQAKAATPLQKPTNDFKSRSNQQKGTHNDSRCLAKHCIGAGTGSGAARLHFYSNRTARRRRLRFGPCHGAAGSETILWEKKAFDLLVGVVLASTLSRAVNGSAAFFPTIGAGFVVIELHRLLALLAFHSHSFGLLIKGEADILIENGRTIQKNVSANYLTDDDLLEEVRLEAAIEDFGKIEKAYIERSGEVSVIVRKS